MKKSLLLLLFCVMALSASAQQHFKFLGADINGTISQFTKKMEAAGLTRDYESSKPFNDCRVFEGDFEGYRADFYVYYHPKTKLVYRAKAVVPFGTELYAVDLAQDMIDKILDTYDGRYDDDPDENGYPNIRFLVESDYDEDEFIGIIDVYVSADDEDDYNVHVDFIDIANAEKCGIDL